MTKPKKGINAIKENKSWKQLPISIGPEAPSSFDLIQFEELDDYSLENIPLSERFDSSDDEHPSKKKEVATPQKTKQTTKKETEKTDDNKEVKEEVAGDDDGNKKKKKKRRRRKKKKQQTEGEKVDEDKEKEEVAVVEEKELDEEGNDEDVGELDLSSSLEVDVSLKQAVKEVQSTQEAEAYDPNILSESATIVKSANKRKMKRKTEKVDANEAKKPKVEENSGEKPKVEETEAEKTKVEENVAEKAENEETKEENKEEDEICENDIIAQIPDWNRFALPLPILRALCDQGFKTPMPIQEQVLPVAIQQRKDILGAAETGSGKTLAFGIPLICHLLEDKARNFIPDPTEQQQQETEEEDEMEFMTGELDEDFDDEELMMSVNNKKKGNGLAALILTPTRELAIQVKNHLVKMTKYTDIRLVAVVGGMNEERQIRLLNKKPDIVIATPGRLNKLVHNSEITHISRLQTLKYLIIDEADRMLERGHFTDLQKLLEIINSPDCYPKRQNFMFSATLTTVRDVSIRVKKQSGYKEETKDKKLEQLSKQLVGKRKPHVVDLTTTKMTAEKLREARILCTNEEKDFYLYYFIKSHPGRTLIFVNSIDCIFRLNGVFEALNCEPLHLHAKMQQRQRLKHLDRFQENENSIMFASDVAARGLDIPDVQNVIHYQVPRTLEVFVHRSGRSARSGKDGLSLLFVSPQESNNYKKICRATNKPEGLPVFPINNDVMMQVKIRVKLAREIDILVHRQKKIRVDNDYFKKMAEEADMICDEELIIEDKQSKEKQHAIKMKRQQLSKLLKKPIFPRGFSGNFITKTGSIQRPNYQFAHN